MADPVWTDGVTPLNQVNMTKLQTRDEKAAANGYASLDAGTKVPLAQLPGGVLPAVVNGQFVKGVGGAAVWAPIADADLPARLGVTGVTIADCNLAITAGWYWSAPGSLNIPPGSSYCGILVVPATQTYHTRQLAYAYDTNMAWERRQTGSVWDTWRLVDSGAQADPAWLDVGFQSGWANLGGGFDTARARRLTTGLVILKGVIAGGGAGSPISAFPVGYRPAGRLAFSAVTDSGPGRVDVQADGTVLHVSGGTGYVTLSGVIFYADQ